MSDNPPTIEERLATLEDRLEFLMGHQHAAGLSTTTPPRNYANPDD
jgi:hypothetical protein